MDTLKISAAALDGAPGVDSDPFNPLARAHRSLFETGRPFERLSACYFDPRPLAHGLRWFGTFVVSSAKRLLYFPGVSDRQSLTLRSKNREAIMTHQLEVDHFTLEPNRLEWHMTGNGTKRHLGRFATLELGEQRSLWFAMSIASPDVLRRVRTTTEVNSRLPATDSRRRAEVAVQVREGVVFQDLLFDQTHQPPIPAFGHFAVIVGPCGFRSYRGNNLAPIGSPFVSLDDLSRPVSWRSHRLTLTPHVDIEIVTALLSGQVSVPIAITSPAA